MNPARSWMLAAALGSFGAGTSTGLLIARVSDTDAAPSSQHEEYVGKLVTDYGLDASQARSLRLIMRNYEEQKDAYVLSVETSQLPPAIQNRLRLLDYQTTNRIRVVLDAPQRARYDLNSKPVPPGSPEPGSPSTAKERSPEQTQKPETTEKKNR